MHKASVIAGFVLVGLAVAYWVGADMISRSVLSGNVGADGLPKLLAVTLGILSLVMIIQERAKLRRSPVAPAAGSDDAGHPQRSGFVRHLMAAGILAIGGGYVLILPYVGYAVSVALLIFAVVWYHGKRSLIGVGTYAVVGAAVFYVIFVVLLDVSMPVGLWPALPSLS
jgi:putative tricarboxylic transport membrane protein